MSELSNRKHEAIAREVGLFGVDLFKAYCAQGYAPHPGNAARLASSKAFDDRVRELSAVAMQKAADLAGVDRGRALAEQARLAYSNIQDYAALLLAENAKAAGEALQALPRDKAAAIQAISWDGNGRLRIKLHDKVAALTTLLRATERDIVDPEATAMPRANAVADAAHTAAEPWAELVSQQPQRAN